MKFKHFLFQTVAISTTSRLAAAVLGMAATFALASCGGGGSPNSSAPPHRIDR